MSRLALDPSTLQVESFGLAPVMVQPGGPETYPDCPTATDCTCIPACASIVRTGCQMTATIETAE